MHVINVFLLLALATGALGQYCDSNPCEHTCIETIDGHICYCYENYELQADGSSCVHKQQAALDATYEGCYMEDVENDEYRDVPYLMWDRTDNTVHGCIRTCRNRGFQYAGLQAGSQCWCGDSFWRLYNTTDTCDMPCTGSPGTMCGGMDANSLYKVIRDDRYMGCWFEDPADLDLPYTQWAASEGRSSRDCVQQCSRIGYMYAGVSLGGQCSCGDAYGKHGLADEDWCMTRCLGGYVSENCGGNSTNAVYRVVQGQDYRIPSSDAPSTRADIPLDGLYKYPHQNGIITNRFLVYASDVVNLPEEDTECFNGPCYGVCGSVEHPEGLDSYRQDIKIRQFHIKLSEIDSYIDASNTDLLRVYVYAQTLVIDASVEFRYSLLIRARQIIVDYAQSPVVTIDHYGAEFSMYNLTEAIYTGVPSDLSFLKMSFLCARMLLSQTDDRSNALGWAIIDDMVRDYAYTPEHATYLNTMRAYRSEFSSLGRNDMNWAPYNTKAAYVDGLEVLYEQMTLYKDIFDEMVDQQMECEMFVDRAGDLLDIWTTAVIVQGEIILRHAETTLEVSQSTYTKYYTNYNESREELVVAAEEFEEGIKQWVRQQLRKFFFGFITAIIKLAFGVFPCGAAGLVKDLAGALGTLQRNLELLEQTMENLAETVAELEDFLLIVDNLMFTEDYERMMDNIEEVAALYPMIEEWDIFRDQVRIIFEEPIFYEISGARGFEIAVYDLCNWGKALTSSVVEYANNARRYVTAASMDSNRRQMKDRYDAYLLQVQQDCVYQDAMIVAFAEQNYDVMYECNEQLLEFCQAYFYESLIPCPSSAEPSFGSDLTDLLLRINSAITYSEGFDRLSSANLTIYVQDDPEAWDDCNDALVCPVKMFRESRTLLFVLPTEHPQFIGVDLFVIERLFLRFEGAYTTDVTRQGLRAQIEASGPFFNKRTGDEYTFVTRAMAGMVYQYELDTGATTLFCDLYQGDDGMVLHQTPFTTWVISIHPEFTHINIDNVTTITMTMEGPFLNLKNAEKQN